MSSPPDLIYSEYALARMFSRGVFKKQVRRTIRRPERAYSQGQFRIAEYTTSSKVLIRAVFFDAPDLEATTVVSVIRLGKHKNGWLKAALCTNQDTRFDVAYSAYMNAKIAETVEVATGIFRDLSSEGEVMGAEIFNYSQYIKIADTYPLRSLNHFPKT